MKNLKTGLSGCKLQLITSNVIRKYSSTSSYNERLNSQFNKQKLFSNFILKNIQTPTTFQITKKHLYYFDMEYIRGHLFDEYFSIANVHDVNFILQSLFDYFDFLISTKKYYKPEISKQIILDKIKTLKTKTNYLPVILKLEKIILKSTLHIPKTFCHGDLTFTNIIFHKNRLYFIDFLDSFVDSFYCDLVKLKQDLHYEWSLKVQSISNLKISRIYVYIWKKIKERYSEYINTFEFEILDLLNTLRLDPYLTDPNKRIIIDNMIQKSSLYENINRSYGGTV